MLCYNSRDIRCKTPFGAVPAGTEVVLRADCDEPLTLVLYRDYEPWRRLPFEGGSVRFRLDFPQVYWYFFETSAHRYYRDPLRNCPVEAEPDGEGATWQLTVYDPSYQTPDWLRGGVMYQVFPDRFACSHTRKQGVPADRRLHASEEEIPDPAEPPGKRPCSDYFGGDLEGIRSRLSRLTSLSVRALYLNPIFEAHSNHRYNTADYNRIDPMLGTEKELEALIRDARADGIRLLLDGVFSHVGMDSVYMNQEERYPAPGAWNDPESPYRAWFDFRPDGSYKCWWNVPSLPEVDEDCPSFRAEIERAVRKWQSMGLGGWRLDVADELPDEFIAWLRSLLREMDASAYLLGEVWEDATTKQKECVRREYLLGHELDAVMNYPWRTAVLDWVLHGDGELFRARIESICENYPAPALHVLMNLLGTHDTPRLLTVLSGADVEPLSPEQKRAFRLTPEQRELAVRREIPAVALQYVLPGLPSVYYGDEQCMEGAGDPYCRGFYSEKNHEESVYETYRVLGEIRAKHACFRDGFCRILRADDRLVVIEREGAGERIRATVNRTDAEVSSPSSGETLFCSNADENVLGAFGVRYEKICLKFRED